MKTRYKGGNLRMYLNYHKEMSNINIFLKFRELPNTKLCEKLDIYRSKDISKLAEKMNKIFSQQKQMLKKIISYRQSLVEELNYYKNVCSKTIETNQRMVIGLGDESVFEVSITLDHLTGVPFIPASSLKGLFKAVIFTQKIENRELSESEIVSFQKKLEEDLNSEDTDVLEMQILFGTQHLKGCLIFTDTYPSHDSFENGNIFEIDITNCHYMSYYTEGKIPGDWENPNPVFFITVRKGIKFKLDIFFDLNRWNNIKEYLKTRINSIDKIEKTIDKWMNQKEIWDTLVYEALSVYGIGAKTRLGYGTFKIL
ncbi:MAG: type III-B CRISPR module RAMP protein Cmr6 [bacterium]|nr:type III-B CRISPR module RAMP protein Cmr6 [bacterium]